LSSGRALFKRVGLHYIGFRKSTLAGKTLPIAEYRKINQIDRSVTNFG